MIYLDHNASTPLLPEVRAALIDALDRHVANASSPHRLAREAAAAAEEARAQVARLAGRAPREVLFTSGATEANALALAGITSEERPELWATAVEHPSVLAWATRRLPVDGRGVIDLDQLEQALRRDGRRVAALSVMAANNETGVLQPLAEVAALAAAHGVRLHCDATQLPGRLPFEVPADLITISAHKMGGPKGVGALIGLPPRPFLRGGTQERGLRPGTPNVPGIVGFGVAAALAPARAPMDPGPRDRLERAIRALGALIVGEGAPRLPNTVTAVFDAPGDLVAAALDLEGVAVSNGSACGSGAAATSAVLAAMGLRGVPVRFSLGADTVVDEVPDVLARVLARCRELQVGAGA